MSEKPDQKELMRRLMENWKVVEAETDRMKTEELRALTEEEAARRFSSLTFPRELIWIAPERHASEGMIEQQRIFARARGK